MGKWPLQVLLKSERKQRDRLWLSQKGKFSDNSKFEFINIGYLQTDSLLSFNMTISNNCDDNWEYWGRSLENKCC